MLDDEMRDTFPNLGDDYRPTSTPTRAYNCIAWAAGDNSRWWEPPLPGTWHFWPSAASQGYGINDLRSAYEAVGFEVCEEAAVERDVDKVALYGDHAGLYKHAARQLANGRWTSKLGEGEDIEHASPHELESDEYGTVVGFMKRPR